VKSGGSWKRLGWDEALDLLAGKIREAVSRRGSESVFYYHDSGSTGLSKSLGLRLFRRVGASEPLGSLCWAAGIQAQEYDFGCHLANAPEDVLKSKMVLIWGRNPAETNVHLVPLLKEARERGARLTLVDPLRSATVKLVDEHVQLRPATDAALALAMCNVVVQEGLADVAFVAACTVGFSAFGRHLEKYSPAWAERITGIPAESVVRLARRYACAKPAAILMGYGFQRHFGGGNAVRACDALAAVTGNVGKEGGGANYASGYIASRLIPLAPEGGRSRPPRRIPRACMSEIASLKDPPVEVMVVSGANPVNQAPGAAAVREALTGIPFKAVLDVRWTETCEASDLFLPVATPFEDQDLHFCSWHPMLTFSERAVEPRGEALPDRAVWQKLAQRLGFGDDFDRTVEEWVDMALARMAPAGLTAEALLGRTLRFPGMPAVAHADGFFLTPSRKFEFYSDRAGQDTGHPMATYVGPGDEAQAADFPLRLLSPRRVSHLHSQFYERMLSPSGLPVAYTSRAELESCGLRDGGPAVLESAQGRIDVELRQSPDVPDGVVLVYEGGSVVEGKGVNLLTPQGETDMGHGPVYYDCFVKISPRRP
jgi:anaerobic selenocysteine-containing dehydrogenase